MARTPMSSLSAVEQERKRKRRRERRQARKEKKARELGVAVEYKNDGTISVDRQELRRRAALARDQKRRNEIERFTEELHDKERRLTEMNAPGYSDTLSRDYNEKLSALAAVPDTAGIEAVNAAANEADRAQARLMSLSFTRRTVAAQVEELRQKISAREAQVA